MQDNRLSATVKLLKRWSAVACLLAVLMSAGGHWYVFQSVAWIRMFVLFAQNDSLAVALVKTFDGQHPCGLCLKIRQGEQQEKSQGESRPWLKPEKTPEYYCDLRLVCVPALPDLSVDAPEFVKDPYANHIESPPKPPPKMTAAALSR